MNISDVHTGYVYKFSGSKTFVSFPPTTPINVNGYIVNKDTGDMIHFTSLTRGKHGVSAGDSEIKYYSLIATTDNGSVTIFDTRAIYDVYIDYSQNTVSRSDVESAFGEYWNYTFTSLNFVDSMFEKANIALVGGTNSEGKSYDGLLGMISKFGKFLVSSPLLLVLCIALPLVSFSVGLIIRIKNRA